MSVSDFIAYQRRSQRMKRLEEVLEAARRVFIASTSKSPDHVVMQALTDLRIAIAEADKIPPPHRSITDQP
jgi:hypothetical protein